MTFGDDQGKGNQGWTMHGLFIADTIDGNGIDGDWLEWCMCK